MHLLCQKHFLFLPAPHFLPPFFSPLPPVGHLYQPTFSVDIWLPLNLRYSVSEISFSHFAFPYHYDSPAPALPKGIVSQVPFTVVLNLCQPELNVCFMQNKYRTTFVAVPEASFTKMHVRYFARTISGLPSNPFTLRRYLYPSLDNSLRSFTSGFVFLDRICDIHS